MALITAVARVQYLAWELLHAMGTAKKKKKNERKDILKNAEHGCIAIE